MTAAGSGRSADALTLEGVRSGDVTLDDVRIDPATLEHQAHVAEAHGNAQLAANFRRAAELAGLPDERVLAIYEALRPRRSTHEQLESIAADLDNDGAPMNAALVREAANVYRSRGLLA